MKRQTILTIIAAVAFLSAPAAILGEPSGPPNGLNVNVVNPIPLPVTGDINSTVSGVEVTNNATKPVPVKSAFVREPFTFYKEHQYTNSDRDFFDLFQVPEDRLAVIETVSAVIVIYGDEGDEIGELTRAELRILFSENNYMKLRYPISFPLIEQGTGKYAFNQVGKHYVGCQQIRVYVSAGDNVIFEYYLDEIRGSFSAIVTVTGYYLPLNSPSLSP